MFSQLEKELPYSKQISSSNKVEEETFKKQEESIRSLERQIQKLIAAAMPDSRLKYESDLKEINALRALSKEHELLTKNPRQKFIWNDNLR